MQGGQPLPPDMRFRRALGQTYPAWACSCWNRPQRLAPANRRALLHLPQAAPAREVWRSCGGHGEIRSSAKRNRMLGRPGPSAAQRRCVFVPLLAYPSCVARSRRGIPRTFGLPRMPSKDLSATGLPLPFAVPPIEMTNRMTDMATTVGRVPHRSRGVARFTKVHWLLRFVAGTTRNAVECQLYELRPREEYA